MCCVGDFDFNEIDRSHVNKFMRLHCEPSTSMEDSVRKMMVFYQNVVDFDDFERNPARIFEIHRQLGKHHSISDVQIRFTVQTNLFTGSVLAFGRDSHVAAIAGKTKLGCFALTERGAGVLSGLVVNTLCEWSETKQKYIINSRENSPKIWISQGFVAHYGVVFATLVKARDGENHGVQCFFVDMSLPGIEKTDMGEKNVAFHLDNAEIFFRNVEVDETCWMNRVKTKNFMELANRLVTGRIILAQCGLARLRNMMDQAQDYASSHPVSSPGFSTLSQMPFFQDLLAGMERQLVQIEEFSQVVEKEYCRTYPVVSPQLLERANALKSLSNEFVLEQAFAIKKNLGSITLFKSYDIDINLFLMYKFAEGDSAILQQKTSRDLLKKCYKAPISFLIENITRGQFTTLFLTFYLIAKMAMARNKENAWFRNHSIISRLAVLRHTQLMTYSK